MYNRTKNKVDIELRLLNAYSYEPENMPSLKARFNFVLNGNDLKIEKQKVEKMK